VRLIFDKFAELRSAHAVLKFFHDEDILIGRRAPNGLQPGDMIWKCANRSYRDLIKDEVEADTRKLSTFDAYLQATADSPTGDGQFTGLRDFAEKRRAFLLSHAEIADLPREIAAASPERPRAASAEAK